MLPRPRSKPAAIITGAESGIGRATALELAAHYGALGVTWYRDAAAIDAVITEASSLGARVVAEHADFNDVERIPEAIERLTDAVGPVDLLVNNAAMAYSERLLNCTVAELQAVLSVNFIAPLRIAQMVARQMVDDQRPGVIINITSVVHDRAKAGSSVYAAAKAALTAITAGLHSSGDRRTSECSLLHQARSSRR